MLKLRFVGLLWILSALCTFSTPRASADFVNGGFESGGLSGWQSIGTGEVVSGGFGIPPAAGIFQALLTNHPAGSLGVSVGQVEAFLGVSSGALDSLGSGSVTQASALKQTITANAGDIISFSWNFLTNEDPLSAGTNDFAFFSIVPGTPSTLANTFSSLSPSSSSIFSFDSGYSVFTVQILSAGTYTVGFGVADSGDTDISSALLLDNVKLTTSAVPEPTSILLSTIGGLVLALKHLLFPRSSRAR